MKQIIVPLAGGPGSIITAKYAIYLAKLLQVKLVAVYVIDENAIQELLKSRIFVEIEAREYEIDMEQQSKLFMQRVKVLAENKKVEFESLILRGEVHTEVTGYQCREHEDNGNGGQPFDHVIKFHDSPV